MNVCNKCRKYTASWNNAGSINEDIKLAVVIDDVLNGLAISLTIAYVDAIETDVDAVEMDVDAVETDVDAIETDVDTRLLAKLAGSPTLSCKTKATVIIPKHCRRDKFSHPVTLHPLAVSCSSIQNGNRTLLFKARLPLDTNGACSRNK